MIGLCPKGKQTVSHEDVGIPLAKELGLLKVKSKVCVNFQIELSSNNTVANVLAQNHMESIIAYLFYFRGLHLLCLIKLL